MRVRGWLGLGSVMAVLLGCPGGNPLPGSNNDDDRNRGGNVEADAGPVRGVQGGPCFDSGLCEPGLVCSGQVCVNAGEGPSSYTAGDDAAEAAAAEAAAVGCARLHSECAEV